MNSIQELKDRGYDEKLIKRIVEKRKNKEDLEKLNEKYDEEYLGDFIKNVKWKKYIITRIDEDKIISVIMKLFFRNNRIIISTPFISTMGKDEEEVEETPLKKLINIVSILIASGIIKKNIIEGKQMNKIGKEIDVTFIVLDKHPKFHYLTL